MIYLRVWARVGGWDGRASGNEYDESKHLTYNITVHKYKIDE